jgi:hypothetical protein
VTNGADYCGLSRLGNPDLAFLTMDGLLPIKIRPDIGTAGGACRASERRFEMIPSMPNWQACSNIPQAGRSETRETG